MTQTQSKQMARLAYEALEDKKARDIRILDISDIPLSVWAQSRLCEALPAHCLP